MLGEPQPETGTSGSFRRSEVFAVIVTYNIGRAIHRCFDAIKDQVEHVLIIDNASDESTRRELNALAASDSVTVIFNDRNEGVAHAYNQAVHWAHGKGYQWILTLDHDSVATPGMVDKLVEAYANLERHGIYNTGVVGANAFDENHQHFLSYQPRDEGGLPIEDGEVISSGSLIPLRIFNEVGLFNEDLFIYYVDTDFCRRLARGGFRIFANPEAVLLHKEGLKLRRKFLWLSAYYDHYGKVARYYLTRNTIYLMKKRSFSLSDLYWISRRLCKDHVKILLFDEERFSTLWFSLMGLLDGLRGKVGPARIRGPGGIGTG